MAIDLLSYFPAFADIPEADILTMRQRIEALLHQAWPDIETRPNSVMGDLALTPLSHLIAAAETAVDRVLSDLQLGNVEQGIIYNCAFVQEYLKNFAIYEQATLQSSGVIRLTFTTDQDYIIDRRARYQFGADAFNLRLPHDGALLIARVGAPLVPGTNTRNLVELTAGVFVADVPVTGTMTVQVAAGAGGATDFPIPELSAITAMADFDFGLPPATLSELARRTRETFYSATPNTPGGAARFLKKEFPELVGISPVVTGDAEMMRDTINPFGLGDGRMDIYVRSKSTVIETIALRVPFIDIQNAAPLNRFVGKLQFTNIPFRITSIIPAGAPTLQLNDVEIFSRSTDAQRAPMATAAYSGLEELWLTVGMPSLDDDNLIPLDIADDGSMSAVFNITYQYDPLLRPVIDVMESRDAAPTRVDVLTKSFLPIIIDRMVVNYTRQRGTTVNLEGARQEILAYVNAAAVPERYSDSPIIDSMYYARAAGGISVECTARVAWSLANRFLPEDSVTPDSDYVTALGNSVQAHAITIVESRGLEPSYRDNRLGTDDAGFEAVGARNVMLCLDAPNLFFSENALQ